VIWAFITVWSCLSKGTMVPVSINRQSDLVLEAIKDIFWQDNYFQANKLSKPWFWASDNREFTPEFVDLSSPAFNKTKQRKRGNRIYSPADYLQILFLRISTFLFLEDEID
jgi:hypothetical protein